MPLFQLLRWRHGIFSEEIVWKMDFSFSIVLCYIIASIFSQF